MVSIRNEYLPSCKFAESDRLSGFPARTRRKQQNLTDKFFNKNRGRSAPGSRAPSRKESPVPGSLASRVEKVLSFCTAEWIVVCAQLLEQ